MAVVAEAAVGAGESCALMAGPLLTTGVGSEVTCEASDKN